MRFNASIELIAAIKAALTLPARHRKWQNERRATAFAAKAWVSLTELGDAMEDQDPRIYPLTHRFAEMCGAFELSLRWVAHLPTNQHADTLMTQGVSATDAAALMLYFKEMGFEVDPTAFISALEPDLRRQERYTKPEMDLLFFSRMTDHCELRLVTTLPVLSGITEKLKTDRGHRIEFAVDGDRGHLVARGPRFRRRKPQVEVTCDYCGYSYTTGDIDASREHRRVHQRKQHAYDPRPLRRFAERLERMPDGDEVSRDSPKWMHREAYERAVMFKREFQYDMPQWTPPPDRGRTEEVGVAYLLTTADDRGTIIGACAFRERDEGWTMDWAWIAPRWRRQGIMQRYWPRFVEKFGDFPLERPLSDAMLAFVSKHGSKVQREAMEERQRGGSVRAPSVTGQNEETRGEDDAEDIF